MTPAKTTTVPDTPVFFGLEEISHGGVISRYIEPELDLRRAVYLEHGDVVLALLGNIGAAAVVSDAAAGAILGRECAALRLRPGEPRITPQWLRLALGASPFRLHARAMATGTTMPRLSSRALGEMTIPVPPSEVQRDLVDRMAKFDDAIEAQRTLLNSLVALRGAEIELSMNELTDPAVHA